MRRNRCERDPLQHPLAGTQPAAGASPQPHSRRRLRVSRPRAVAARARRAAARRARQSARSDRLRGGPVAGAYLPTTRDDPTGRAGRSFGVDERRRHAPKNGVARRPHGDARLLRIARRRRVRLLRRRRASTVGSHAVPHVRARRRPPARESLRTLSATGAGSGAWSMPSAGGRTRAGLPCVRFPPAGRDARGRC